MRTSDIAVLIASVIVYCKLFFTRRD